MEALVAIEEGLLARGQLLPDHLLGAQPAAGVAFVQALDSRWWWRFRAVRFQLVADANAANRFVSVDFCDAEGTSWIRNPALAVQIAAATQVYDFCERSIPVSGIAGQPQFADLSKVFVPPGWQLRINVSNVQVGDQLSAIRMYVDKFEPAV